MKNLTFLAAGLMLVSSMAVPRAEGVTAEMCDASYWLDKAPIQADALLMTAQEIEELNAACLGDAATKMYDLENLDAAISDPGYAVVVRRTEILSAPTVEISYSEQDSYPEEVLSAMNVNEPFLVCGDKIRDGFCYGYSNHYEGWVRTGDLAFCSDKEEWLDTWKVDITSDNFLVVTADRIYLEPSLTQEYSSEVLLGMGTTLKLVPAEEVANCDFAERAPWNNYVVYLPVRADDGTCVRKPAMIPQHHSVSIGYLPMTQENILELAFSALGDRYGWGGMLQSFDCSYYTKSVYKCFGLELPRDTSLQAAMPGCVTDVSGMSDEEKLSLLADMPLGTILYFKGHVFMYIGMADDMAYVINADGSLCESESGEGVSVNTVIINPLTVRRGAAYGYDTWLSQTTAFISPSSIRYGDSLTTVDKPVAENEATIAPGAKAEEALNQAEPETEKAQKGADYRLIIEISVFTLLVIIIIMMGFVLNAYKKRARKKK